MVSVCPHTLPSLDPFMHSPPPPTSLQEVLGEGLRAGSSTHPGAGLGLEGQELGMILAKAGPGISPRASLSCLEPLASS